MTWLLPALKLIVPHVGTIISAAAPAFTTRKAAADAQQSELMQQQIAELQQAAKQNDRMIRDLAAQLQEALTQIENAAAATESRLRRLLVVSIAAGIASLAALVISILLVVR